MVRLLRDCENYSVGTRKAEIPHNWRITAHIPSLKVFLQCTWSEFDFKPISCEPGIREEGLSVGLRVLFLHVV